MDKYKCKSFNFRGSAESRMFRMIKRNQARKSIRCEEFEKRRNIKITENVIVEESQNIKHDIDDAKLKKVDSRRLQLLRWKEERALLKKVQEAKKKPLFKVVHVTHDRTPLLSSEVVSKKDLNLKLNSLTICSRPITRSMAASNKEKNSSKVLSMPNKKIERAIVHKIDVKENKKNDLKDKALKKEKLGNRKSFAPENFKFFVPGNLVNFNWQPTPLTPRSSRQFVFTSDSEGSESYIGRDSSTPKVNQRDNVCEAFTGISLSSIHHSTLSSTQINAERPKVEKSTTAKIKISTLSESDKTGMKNEQFKKKTDGEFLTQKEPQIQASQSGKMYDTRTPVSTSVSKMSGSSAGINLPGVEQEAIKENKMVNNETATQENINILSDKYFEISERSQEHVKISEGILKMEISSIPQRVLRSNKQRVSLLYSPAPREISNHSNSVSSDLISFSPAEK